MADKKNQKKKVLVRIQKIIADSGLCSRRNAEELIKAGRVKINGEYAEIGQSANKKTDIITVDDRPLQTQKKRYIIMHKPFGYHTTTQDPFAPKKVVDILERAGIKERLYPVGRLDKNASGLLLLTNDGDWANKVIHPSVGFEKEYHAKTSKAISKAQMNEIRNGIMLKDGPVQAKVKAVARGFYSITLKAGRHKIVKRIFKYFGIHVTSLKRVRIGPYKIGSLNEGEIQEISEEMIKQTVQVTPRSKQKRPAKIFTKKPRYDQREIPTRRGKEKRSTRKTSPKIDSEFTKRYRAEQRNPALKTQRRRREREEKETKKDRKYSKRKDSESSKKYSKTGSQTKSNNNAQIKNPFKRDTRRQNKTHSTDKTREKRSPSVKKSKKFTANTEKRIKPSFSRSSSSSSERLHSVGSKKPFNKEKIMKRVGKKKNPMKPKKGRKSKWD